MCIVMLKNSGMIWQRAFPFISLSPPTHPRLSATNYRTYFLLSSMVSLAVGRLTSVM